MKKNIFWNLLNEKNGIIRSVQRDEVPEILDFY